MIKKFKHFRDVTPSVLPDRVTEPSKTPTGKKRIRVAKKMLKKL